MIILKIFNFNLPKIILASIKIILINYKMLIEKQSIIYFRLSKEIKQNGKHAKLHFLKEGDLTIYFYIWNKKEYLTSDLFDLTESEKQEINHQVIDEIEEEK